MKLVAYRQEDASTCGLLLERPGERSMLISLEHAIQVDMQAGEEPFWEKIPVNLEYILTAGDPALTMLRRIQDRLLTAPDDIDPHWLIPIEAASLLPPIQRPGKLICVGLNYPDPIDPSPAPPYPVLFHKTNNTLVGHGSPIVIPRISRMVDYEAELAVVIGRSGKRIPEENALDWVAGYTIANDVGAPDIQARSSQWTSGKMLDSFCPLGPALVTREDLPDPSHLAIRTEINGIVVQDACTEEMIFNVPKLVSYISELATLQPGDLILTGSPKRLGKQRDPRQILQPGDMVSIQIEKLGTLVNPVAAEEE